jgi:hypothetical protein
MRLHRYIGEVSSNWCYDLDLDQVGPGSGSSWIWIRIVDERIVAGLSNIFQPHSQIGILKIRRI